MTLSLKLEKLRANGAFDSVSVFLANSLCAHIITHGVFNVVPFPRKVFP